MNPSANKTLYIQNTTAANVSLQLHQLRSPASPSFRRGMLLTAVSVPAGGYYDVCKGLQVTYDEADSIVEGSPDYHLHRRKGRIYKRAFPPDPVPVEKQLGGLSPAAAAVGASVEIVPGGETTLTPAVTTAETGVAAPEMPETSSFLVDTPQAVPLTEPSMEWSEDQLREYAVKHDIDISKAKSKTAVLRLIRK